MVAIITLAACQAIFKNKDKADVADSTPDSAAIKKNPDTIAVIPPIKRDSNLRYVYLTFDDGPDAGTLNCYKVCQDKGVKATFFLVGEHAD